jgi:hypothetical protein
VQRPVELLLLLRPAVQHQFEQPPPRLEVDEGGRDARRRAGALLVFVLGSDQ